MKRGDGRGGSFVVRCIQKSRTRQIAPRFVVLLLVSTSFGEEFMSVVLGNPTLKFSIYFPEECKTKLYHLLLTTSLQNTNQYSNDQTQHRRHRRNLPSLQINHHRRVSNRCLSFSYLMRSLTLGLIVFAASTRSTSSTTSDRRLRADCPDRLNRASRSAPL